MDINKLILKDLNFHLKKHVPGMINKIILFGSRINGNAEEYSDFDLLVILNHEYDWTLEEKIIDLCYDIDLKYDIITDIKIISKDELNSLRGKQSYIVNAIKNGHVL